MFFVKCVFGPLAELCYPEGRKSHERRAMIHFDNASIHNAEEVQKYLPNVEFIRMKHPLYRRDLALCDFFLFEAIKKNFSVYRFDGLDELSVAVESFLNALSEDFLSAPLQERIRRLQVCCDSGREYVE
jgi:hypothetical protein